MRNRKVVAACTFAVALLVALTVPRAALADPFTDISNSINSWLVDSIFEPAIKGMLTEATSLITSINASTLLTVPFSGLFGQGEGLYQLAGTVNNGIVKPIAHSILALVMLVQLVKISQRVDGTATLPAVKEVVELFVFFVIFNWLINNAGSLCAAIFDDLAKICSSIGDAAPNVAASLDPVSESALADLGAVVPVMITCVAVFICALVAQVVAQLMVYARAIQLYIYFMLSPIPFALLGFDGTRHLGIMFVRNFCALCLAGAIMMFVLCGFPMLIDMVASDVLGSVAGSDPASALTWPLKLVVVCLLLIFSLVKSGTWARDVLGG